MAGKYSPLTEHLRAAVEHGQAVEMDFDEVSALVGGLPASAGYSRQWWANGSHVQALAWREAGCHVETVDFQRRRVWFEAGVRGGIRQSSHVSARHGAENAGSSPRAPGTVVGQSVDVRVVVQWTDAGPITLDASGRPVFSDLELAPGLYRLTFTGAGLARPQCYVGETENLRRRMWNNYRNPGRSQQTSLRINAEICRHLSDHGHAQLAVATGAEVFVAGDRVELDLRRKSTRCLAENAAILMLRTGDVVEILNVD